MPRNITIFFDDGSGHRYENIPDTVTPDMIESRVKKDFPSKRITRIDGGKKGLPPLPTTANTELDQVKKNAGISTTPQSGSNPNLSQFSIKGLRFGMTVEEVVRITKATEDDLSKDRDKTTYEYPKKTTSSDYKSLEGFSIGGSSSWYPSYTNDKLGAISLTISPNSFEEWFEKLSSKYGKPTNMSAAEVGNLMGYKSKNIEVFWNYQDVVIYLDRYSSKLTEGQVSIQWKKYQNDRYAKKQAEKEKRKKDFE